ncbi:MAG: hypothetical protein V8S58_02215 [Lachnospiraceae bacterium]
MNETGMKNKVASGLFWKLLENGGAQGIQFVIAILSGQAVDSGGVWRGGDHHDFYHHCKCICPERLFYGSGAEKAG